MNQLAEKQHTGNREKLGLQTGQVTHVAVLCSLIINRNGTTLMGYALDDGHYEFIVNGKRRTFATIKDVWDTWDNVAADVGLEHDAAELIG